MVLVPAVGTANWAAANIGTFVNAQNKPAVTITSPSSKVHDIPSIIQLYGASDTDSTNTINAQADTITLNGTTSISNVAVGGVVITPTAANTPTKGTVTYPALTGSTAHGFAVAQNSNANTFVSITNITATSADIWISRPNTTATGVYYMIWYT